jgi:hypothetical protein
MMLPGVATGRWIICKEGGEGETAFVEVATQLQSELELLLEQ